MSSHGTQSAKRLRVLVTGLPGLLRDIVCAAISREDDLEVVGEGSVPGAELAAEIGRSRADAVVLGCTASEVPEIGRRLLREYPYVKVLAVVEDGRRGVVVSRESSTALEDLSPEDIVAAIRSPEPGVSGTGGMRLVE